MPSKKVAEAESKNLKLQHEISSLKAEIFKTSEDTQDKERLHSDLKLDLNEARKEIDRLKVTLNDAESSLQKQRLSLNEENRSKYIIKELEAEISSLQESLNNALIDLKDVNEYADECEREISQLKLGISQSPPSSTNSRSNRKSISGTENNVELVELRLKLQDVQNQLSESDEKINILEKNKSHLSSLFKEFQSKANLGVTEAKQQLDEAKITIEELMKKIASLEEENENLRNRHDRIQSQLDSKNIPTMQEVLNLEQQVSSLANQLRENESQKDLANNSRIDTEHVVEELKSQVASLESLLATNQVETIKLQQELVLHNGKDISKLQEQIETLQSSNMDLQSQLEQLSKINIPSKSNDNAELLDEIEFLKLENGGLLDQYNALLAQTPQESTQKIQELEDEVYHITKQAEDYLSELEALDGQIELLQSTLEASKKNQKELEEKYSEQNLTVLQLKEELEAAKIMKENELSNIEIQQDTGIDVDVLSNEDEKASLLLKIDALKKDFSNFETRESELQHEKQDLESYLIQFKSELQICQETLILSSNDTSIIKQEREELRQKIEQLTSEIRYIQEQNEGMKVELMKQLEGVDILESRVFDLEATAKISAENVSLLEAENKALLEEIKASTIQSNNDSDDRLRIKAENSALINETKAAQYQIADHLAKIEDFRNRQSILEAENKKLLEEVKVAQHQITEQLQKISNLNKLVDERNDLEAKNFSLVEELKTAHEQIAAHLIEIGNGPSNFALQEEIAGYLAKLAEFDKLAENHDRLESENARLAEDLSNLLKTSPLEATANSLEDVYSEKQESLSVRSDISNIKDLLKEQIDNLVIANEELSRQLKESDEKILEMRDQITVMKAVAEGGETPNDMQIMVQKTFQQVAELSDERDSLQEQNEMLTQKVEELQKKIRPSSGESTPKKKGYFF
ncbi:hypothetical protein HK100_007619 [Physocladia obscura]|uniref:Uncharacterized protein n=1 Tax=Physocladia obscura TaxID=109957 RepID=A0AAD5XFS1_9FUNG|nr:hypothetical protein HK100_007619 [Physocladia obscura]